MEGLKAILFDGDGVLFDATELHRVCLNAALERYGYTITEQEHKEIFNGLPTRVKLLKLTELKGLPLAFHDKIEEEKQYLTLTKIPEIVKPITNITNTLMYLRLKGYKTGVCSNSRISSLEFMVKSAKLENLLDVVVGNEAVVNQKPEPDIYLLGAKLLGVKIEECCIVEDSPIGLAAAHAAMPGLVIDVANPYEVSYKLFEDLEKIK